MQLTVHCFRHNAGKHFGIALVRMATHEIASNVIKNTGGRAMISKKPFTIEFSSSNHDLAGEWICINVRDEIWFGGVFFDVVARLGIKSVPQCHSNVVILKTIAEF